MNDSLAGFFQKAVELLGEGWLKTNEQEYFENSDGWESRDDIDITGDSAPKPVRQYHLAKEDLSGGAKTGPLDFEELREDSLAFLGLGKAYAKVEDADVVDASGKPIPGKEVSQLYRPELRLEGQYENFLFEIVTGAEYVERGYDPAFVDEEATSQKTPDIELQDLERRIQIECKRCARTSVEEEKTTNIFKVLSNKTRSVIEEDSYIALYDLSTRPTQDEVDNFSRHFEGVGYSGEQTTVQFPFGELHLLPFPGEDVLQLPIVGSTATEPIVDLYEVFVRPALRKRIGVDKDPTELGDWHLYSSSNRQAGLINFKLPIWIGILEKPTDTEMLNRFRKQFGGVSGKFDDCLGILHVEFDDLRSGDALQDLRLRKQAGGELKQRPEISAVEISRYDTRHSGDEVVIKWAGSFIPNYSPECEVPDELLPEDITVEDAIARDNLVTDAEEEFMEDEQGALEGLKQDEGSFTFRFTPRESSDVDSTAIICSLGSEDDGIKVELSITPDQFYKLKREKNGERWECKVDAAKVPDFESFGVGITWTPTETTLHIIPESREQVLSSTCNTPEEI